MAGEASDISARRGDRYPIPATHQTSRFNSRPLQLWLDGVRDLLKRGHGLLGVELDGALSRRQGVPVDRANCQRWTVVRDFDEIEERGVLLVVERCVRRAAR